MASQPTPSPQAANLDRYVVIHVATTCDEHGVYVTKDSADSARCEILRGGKPAHSTATASSIANLPHQLHRESVLVKPVNTPITALCSKFLSSPPCNLR
jgi:hypothetical protein